MPSSPKKVDLNPSSLPAEYSKRRVYTKADVAKHDKGTGDCWVSFFGKVYDLAPLLAEHEGSELALPLLKAAGTDITHWFNEETHEPKTYVDWHTGVEEVYCPQGRYIHIPPPGPMGNFDTRIPIPWWENKKLCIGELSAKTVKINVLNMLTKQTELMEVPSEEKIREIEARYLAEVNFHSKSYTWKRLGKPLDMDKTLAQNGIVDDSEELLRLGFDPDDHILTLHLYFNDDLTEA